MGRPDRPRPLATSGQLTQSELGHLFEGQSSAALDELLMRATRKVETFCGRRLAPFTGLVETHRADGVDSSSAPHPLAGDVAALSSWSYGRATGVANQVRQVWLHQHAPHYVEMWSYRDVTITVHTSLGATYTVPTQDLLLDGPDPETGLLWFRAGTLLGPGDRVRVRYSGGYDTVPSDLVAACRYMAAAEIVDEDDFGASAPSPNSHDDAALGRGDGGFTARAERTLASWVRSSLT